MDGRHRDDDHPVLRSLRADVEREDPALAALLSGRTPVHGPPSDSPPARHAVVLLLAGIGLLALLLVALVLPVRVLLAVSAMLVILASPLVACWLLESGDGQATARQP